MDVTSEQRVDDVVERRFTLGEISGILWMPGRSSDPVPLVLAGQPGGSGGMAQTYPRLLRRAHDAARAGLAMAPIELPGSGDRRPPAGVDRARKQLHEKVSAGEPVDHDLIDRLVLPLVDAAVPEWQRALDWLVALPEIGDRVGYSGGLISVGIRLLAVDPRVSAAVLFAGSLVPRPIMDEAHTVTIPLYVLLQWDDEGNDRRSALELFDAFGSREKTLNANLGGHLGVPQHASEAAIRFLVGHLALPR